MDDSGNLQTGFFRRLLPAILIFAVAFLGMTAQSIGADSPRVPFGANLIADNLAFGLAAR